MRRPLTPLITVSLALVVALAGCGDDGGDNAAPISGADGALEVAALDIEFDRDSYATSAGEVEVRYVQQGSIAHTLVIEGVDGFKLEVSASDDVDQGRAELEPGTYTLYCDVPGHREAGMVATLEVT